MLVAQSDNKKESFWEKHRENIEPAEEKLGKVGTPSKLSVGEMKALIQSANESKGGGGGKGEGWSVA